MPTYEPAHDIFVMYAEETGSVTESTDGSTAPTAIAVPGSMALIGYLKNTAEVRLGLNNSWGYAVGSARAAYRKRGARNPELSQTLAVVDKTFCQKAIRNTTTGLLPRLCIAIGRPNVWTLLIRDAKINTLALSSRESPTGEASEVEAQCQIMGTYVQYLGSPMNPSLGTLLRGLGTPFYWHDVRQFAIEDSAGTATDYRQGTLMSWSINLNNNLERKGERQNFGDNSGFSNTNYSLLEHNEVVTGEIALHGRLPAAAFNAVAQAQDWGDIVMSMSDGPGLNVPSGAKTFTATIEDAFPFDYTINGVESNSQVRSTIPYGARSLAIS